MQLKYNSFGLEIFTANVGLLPTSHNKSHERKIGFFCDKINRRRKYFLITRYLVSQLVSQLVTKHGILIEFKKMTTLWSNSLKQLVHTFNIDLVQLIIYRYKIHLLLSPDEQKCHPCFSPDCAQPGWCHHLFFYMFCLFKKYLQVSIF